MVAPDMRSIIAILNTTKMIESIKKIFGFGASVNYAALVGKGAKILDVRSKSEFSSGHIDGAINIPLEELEKNLHKVKDKTKHIITCCLSGARSASAKTILNSNGYINVYNGGGWRSLNQKIR